MPEKYRPNCVYQGCQLDSRAVWCVLACALCFNGMLEIEELLETQLTLFPYPDFSSPTPLVKTKGALCFALYTGVEYSEADTAGPATPTPPGKGKGIPSVVTRLAVGCRRKIVLYSWKDGEPQEVQVCHFHGHASQTTRPNTPSGSH